MKLIPSALPVTAAFLMALGSPPPTSAAKEPWVPPKTATNEKAIEGISAEALSTANAGDPVVQRHLAERYERAGQLSLAYKWYAIAVRIAPLAEPSRPADPELAEKAAMGRDRVAARMSRPEIAASAKLANDWRPDRTGCYGSFWRKGPNGRYWNDLIAICSLQAYERTKARRFSGGTTF